MLQLFSLGGFKFFKTSLTRSLLLTSLKDLFNFHVITIKVNSALSAEVNHITYYLNRIISFENNIKVKRTMHFSQKET